MIINTLPADLDPRTFAIRHIIWRMFSVISQENLIVIIVPFKLGTEFFHYREEIKKHFNCEQLARCKRVVIEEQTDQHTLKYKSLFETVKLT